MIVNTGKNTSRIPIKSEIFKHASDFKRVDIFQMNGGLKEKYETMIIIGNGFDLHHEMKIKYSDYREYLLANGNENIVKCFEKDSGTLVPAPITSEGCCKTRRNQLRNICHHGGVHGHTGWCGEPVEGA